MGRRSHTQRLNIWMNDYLVGSWERGPSGEKLTYEPDWAEDERGRPLSLSLPFTPGNMPYRGGVVSSYFDNLLPDSEPIRKRLAQRYKTGSIDPFDLLTALGRDCVGAIQLLPEDEEPEGTYEISGEPLDEAAIAELLRKTTSTAPLGLHHEDDDTLRLSIAGAQEKTALLLHEGRWMLPRGSTPTTHILKLPLGLVGNMKADMRTSVENEWLCSRIVSGYGIPIAACDIAQFEEQKVLVVERFDRRRSEDGSWIIRLPQEDMCQAKGMPPFLKYQADGGPGIATIMDILRGSDNTAADQRHFFKTQLIFWLLAATDGHAKNFSIAHLPGSRYRATPIYDVLSAHPILGTGKNHIPPQKAKLAMAIRGSTNYYLISKIQRRHWTAQAKQLGLGNDFAEELIEEVIRETPSVIAMARTALPANFPMDVAESIFSGIEAQCDRLATMPKYGQV